MQGREEEEEEEEEEEKEEEEKGKEEEEEEEATTIGSLLDGPLESERERQVELSDVWEAMKPSDESLASLRDVDDEKFKMWVDETSALITALKSFEE